MIKLPVKYSEISWRLRKQVREQYIVNQRGLCWYCGKHLNRPPKQTKKIDLSLFPPKFLSHPIHLQHDHETGLTEGAVHGYCNAILWQYEGK